MVVRGARPGHAGVADRAHRRPRHAARLQPLRGRLGARHGHAVPVDQAGRLALGRHAQRDDRALAGAASRPRARSATSSTTSSTSRRPSSRRPALPFPTLVNGVDQEPLHGVSMRYCFDDAARRRAPRDPVLRDDVQPRHLPQGLDRGHQARHPVGVHRAQRGHRGRRLGALRHDQGLVAGARPRRRACPTSSPSSSGCSRSRRPSTTCSRSTRASPSASTPRWPGAPTRSPAPPSSCSAACTACRRTSSSTSRTSRTRSPPRSRSPTTAPAA